MSSVEKSDDDDDEDEVDDDRDEERDSGDDDADVERSRRRVGVAVTSTCCCCCCWVDLVLESLFLLVLAALAACVAWSPLSHALLLSCSLRLLLPVAFAVAEVGLSDLLLLLLLAVVADVVVFVGVELVAALDGRVAAAAGRLACFERAPATRGGGVDMARQGD